MLDIILDFLTCVLIVTLIAGIIFGVIVFALAATWMQVNDGKEIPHEQKAGAPEGVLAAPAAQRKRRRASQGYTA